MSATKRAYDEAGPTALQPAAKRTSMSGARRPAVGDSPLEQLRDWLGFGPDRLGSNRAPVFVMLPLDFALESRTMTDREFHRRLGMLADAGVEGIMVDVWWGLCEPRPREYFFQKYKTLVDQCDRLGLKVQATMSFHQCGGNVGDDVNIPLPDWVVRAADERELWFTDKLGEYSQEYVSFAADNERVFEGRTPRECYADFMEIFAKSMGSHMGTTIVEVQVGVGPCGELRYPSYPMSRGWEFPGIGEFQCYDKLMIADLQAKAAAAGHPEWGMPPEDTGSYSSDPKTTGFFKDKEDGGSWVTPRGQFFLQWYFEIMLTHGDTVLAAAYQALAPHRDSVALAVKIAGIHWWYKSQSHAAELTTGYNNAGSSDAYSLTAQMLAKYKATFCFTCLEMSNEEQPAEAMCAPENLVRQVLHAVRKYDIKFAGENALERYDRKAFAKIRQVYEESQADLASFTYLRFTDELFTWWSFWNFRNFIRDMNRLT